MMKPTPTVDEIISALRIVRKFSPQKIILLRKLKCYSEQLVNKKLQSITSFLLYIRYKYTTTCTTLLLKRFNSQQSLSADT